MTKKILIIMVAVFCIAALTACSQEPKPSSVAATVALPSQAAATASQAVSPSISPAQTKSAAPTSSAKATKKPSASAGASASGSASNGASIEQVVSADDINKKYADSLKVAGEDIKVTVQNDTLTFNVTLDQDVKLADFTADMQKQYQDDMNMQIQTVLTEYPNIPDCIFAYNLVNKSGETLMQSTQFYTAE